MNAFRKLAAMSLLALCAATCNVLAFGGQLGAEDARHLLVRTGFGATPDEIARYATLTREQAVDRILAATRTTPTLAPPAFATVAGPLARPGPQAGDEERRAFRREQARQALALRGWWIDEMLATASPLTERMTLFWHNHFVSSQQKVRIARLMYAQNATLRRYAVGDFRALLHAAAKDPAMEVYLDTVQNRKGAPNENFAREVMELFTLGEGHYTEQDVKEAARAFTGWSVDRQTGAFMFRPRLHDDGDKTIFGRRGNFDGDAVLDLILARPEASRFIVGKLWREFVSPDPDRAAVERIAERFRASGYDIKVALRGLLLAPAFWARENRGTLVKSPVELVAGTLHTLGIAPEAGLPYARAAARMSQNLFAPPNVKGWPGGERWIDTTTLLARKQFVERVARARLDASAWLDEQPGDDLPAKLAFAQNVLLPLPPVSGDVGEARAQRDPVLFVRAALLDPVYQLK
jgi:uncharacterized protein (DUF1800 family)